MEFKELVDNCGESSRSQNPILNALDMFTKDKSGVRDQHYGQRNFRDKSRLSDHSFSTEEFERFHSRDPLSQEFERNNNLRGFNVNNAPRYDYGGFQRHSHMIHHHNSNFNSQKWIDDYNKMSMKNDNWVESFEKIHLSEKRIAPMRQDFQFRKESRWQDEFIKEYDDQDFKNFDEVYNNNNGDFTKEFLQNNHFDIQEDDQDWIKSFESYEEFGRKYAEEYLKSQSEEWIKDFQEENMDDELTLEKLREIQENLLKNQEYLFSEEHNPYNGGQEAFEKGLDLFHEGNLSEAILALESVVKVEPEHSKAWYYLGLVQAENDKDYNACLALEKSLESDPNNLDTLVALTVSYTNTYEREKVVQCLIKWIHLKPEYEQYIRTSSDLNGDVDRDVQIITEIYLKAARSRPNDPDPDVQIALGLLFNLEFQLDKAADCFKAALSKRPSDYSLWNKLGATQANNRKFEQAIDAYFRALNIKPSYTRARSNLGISFMSLRDYGEAAKGFLSALTINPNADHIWDNLVTVFKLMNRKDLEDKCKSRDPNVFSEDFNF